LKFYIEKDYKGMSRKAADLTADKINQKKGMILGLATGSTPIGLYQKWIEKCKKGELSFRDVKTFNLDEYLGLPKEHSQSYWTFMQEQLFQHIDIDPTNVRIPCGDHEDPEEHCKEYERELDACGGVDLQILGIGRNGHIGFNEPGESFENETHVVRLAEDTRVVNSRFFDDLSEVPTHAITMGLKSIMKAKEIILLASGDEKSEAIYRTLFGEIDSDTPASILRLHPNVSMIVDEGAAAKVKGQI